MKIKQAIEELEAKPKRTRFSRLKRICEIFFGPARIRGSHHIYSTPWQGNPRINLQNDGGMAKSYQIKQVLQALRKLDEMGDES